MQLEIAMATATATAPQLLAAGSPGMYTLGKVGQRESLTIVQYRVLGLNKQQALSFPQYISSAHSGGGDGPKMVGVGLLAVPSVTGQVCMKS